MATTTELTSSHILLAHSQPCIITDKHEASEIANTIRIGDTQYTQGKYTEWATVRGKLHAKYAI